jgi:polyhydroxybutyrate depolymerase
MEPAPMSRRTVLAAIFVLIAAPAVFALIERVTFDVRSRTNGTVISSGVERKYLLYVPRSYDRAKPAPLVISMHGAGGWATQQMDVSGWNELAETEGLIVVYPEGGYGGGPRVWSVEHDRRVPRDVRFISDLIDKLQATYNIDATRIYANGLSNGGGMSFLLSCTLANRIAAVGLVSSALTHQWDVCTDTRPVPMIAFHGTADPVTRYHGGKTWVAPESFPDIPLFVGKWARRNRCAPDPVESRVAADVSRRAYINCADDAPVVLYTFHGGGHTWPGGKPLPEWFVGRTPTSVDATSQMWVFFRAHPLPKR